MVHDLLGLPGVIGYLEDLVSLEIFRDLILDEIVVDNIPGRGIDQSLFDPIGIWNFILSLPLEQVFFWNEKPV